MSESIARRLGDLEGLVEFLAKSFQVQKRYRSIIAPDQEIVESSTLWDIYKQTQGLRTETRIESNVEPDVEPNTIESNTPDTSVS